MMLDWLRKLMAGDQTAVPPDANVERDEQGRVTRISQTLTPDNISGTPAPTPDQPAEASYPPLAPPGAMARRLDAASAWLEQQNIALARDHGIGLEENFQVDQESGLLTLIFPDGRERSIRATIIGSFNPRDRSFMWGWANSSVRPEMVRDAAALLAVANSRADPDLAGHPALTTPVQTVTFDTLTPLLALAAQTGGADGVYRCITGGSTSIFLAIRADGAAATAEPDPELAEQALAMVQTYDAEMLPIDAAYHAGKDQEDSGRADHNGLMEQKQQIYHRYWQRDDDYWLPSSLGWPSDHDASRQRLIFTAPHPAGGELVVAIFDSFGDAIHRVERVNGTVKITDMLIEWGKGFVWPKAVVETSAD